MLDSIHNRHSHFPLAVLYLQTARRGLLSGLPLVWQYHARLVLICRMSRVLHCGCSFIIDDIPKLGNLRDGQYGQAHFLLPFCDT